ncbi:hypothetical protein APA_2036 [Pseudanabaena sp. lw0831]|nr:hypothetical protein APA_2036 [Pseudanabaena sp. lw0831]
MNIKPRIEKFFASKFHCVVDIAKTKTILSYPYLTDSVSSIKTVLINNIQR